jgi:hypothetical protein
MQAPSIKKNLLKKKQKPFPLIRVLGFQDPLSIEMYEYTLTENKPGFINNFRMWSWGELESDPLTEANFIGLKMQGDFALTGNEYLLYDDGYARYWMIVSTADTRSEGLRVLKSFFMSTQATNYPPGSIEITDMTTELPAYFLDNDIEESLKPLLIWKN